MERLLNGRVWVFGDDINTDLINPGFALHMPPDEKVRHCFSANRPGWVDEVQPGDVLAAGRNFGVGSARPIGHIFGKLGISVIIADSFNGLGLRNCVNGGLRALPCRGIAGFFDEGDIAEVEWSTGQVRNLTKKSLIQGQPIPKALQDIVEAGGIEAVLHKEGFLLDA